MSLRDDVEALLTGWDAHERARGAAPVIDFDCRPELERQAVDVTDRLDVLQRVEALLADVEAAGEDRLVARLTADRAYLRALLSERLPLDVYVEQTQGAPARGWPVEYVQQVRADAVDALAEVGVKWGAGTADELEAAEGGPLAVEDAGDEIRQAAGELEDAVRQAVGTSSPFRLTVELVDLDAYWSYWLDGSGDHARLRINRRRAKFTQVRARQFALHEVLGHGLEYASVSDHASAGDVPWPRILSVHCPEQTLLEGLAQAMPLFVLPDDEFLTARVRLEHYTQLVRAELHLAVNAGTPAAACLRHALDQVPWWTTEDVADFLHDRSVSPLLRSYLWSYPAGIDWFVRLANAPTSVSAKVLHEAYRRPLHPTDLADLWLEGPPIGGPGDPVRLRQPPLP
jgi:hypothetical protein